MTDLERVFDVITHISKNPKSDYKFDDKTTLTPDQQGVYLSRVVQCFMHEVGHKVGKEVSIQAFSGSSDLPQLTKDAFNVTQQVNNFDLYWQQAFKTVRLLEGQLEWEIATVGSGLVFEKIPEGGKVRLKKLSGDKITVGVEKYGCGLGITWEIIKGRKLYRFIDLMEQARAALYKVWADTHYGLLAAAGNTHQVSYQGAASDGELRRDILTLNKGLNDIAKANKDKGYGNPTEFQYLLYPDPALEERIEACFRVTTADQAAGLSRGQQVRRRNVARFYSYNSSIPSNKALLVIPGQKAQNAVVLKELGLSKQEIESLNEVRTYWTAFGAAMGDTDQVYELAFS